jgi:hypothetical protein
MPPRLAFNDLRESLTVLLETQRTEIALRTVQLAMGEIHNQHAWVELRAVLEPTIGKLALRAEPWIVAYAQVLHGCRVTAAILEISRLTTNPLVQLERAWALVITEQFPKA